MNPDLKTVAEFYNGQLYAMQIAIALILRRLEDVDGLKAAEVVDGLDFECLTAPLREQFPAENGEIFRNGFSIGVAQLRKLIK